MSLKLLSFLHNHRAVEALSSERLYAKFLEIKTDFKALFSNTA